MNVCIYIQFKDTQYKDTKYNNKPNTALSIDDIKDYNTQHLMPLC